MMLRNTILASLCLAACGLIARAEEKLQPLTTTIEVAKRPPEPQPTVAPREKPIEFFVDGPSPAASDDNPGTEAKPFRTINRGLRELKPGDTLTVRAGTYRESVRLSIIASAEHPVVLRAAPGQTVVLKGSEVVKGWVKDGNFWKKEGWTKQYVEKNFAKSGNTFAEVVQVYQKDGIGGEAIVLCRVKTREELHPGKCYWDEKTGALTIAPMAGKEPFDPNKDGVEVPVRVGGLTIDRGRYNTVRGFQLRQFVGGVHVSGWHCTAEDCVSTWQNSIGLFHGFGFYNVLRRCEASYCGWTGMGGGWGEKALIEDCVITHNNRWRWEPLWHAGGAKMSTWFDKSVIRGCRFCNNYGPGLWFDYSCNANIVENNIACDNEGPGFMIEISRGNILRNNISCNNHKTMLGIDCVPVDKGQTDYYRQESGGGEGPLGILISSSPYTKVYNNLCYHNDGFGIVVRGGRRSSGDVLDYSDLREQSRREVWVSSHDVDVRNNALINNGRCQLNLPHNGQDADTFGNISDYNLYYSDANIPLLRWDSDDAMFQSLEKWQKASGHDMHSIVGAPLFEFSPSLDLRFQADSPGVDQGQSLVEVPTDRLGVKRPAGRAADIGPYEIAGLRRFLPKPKTPEKLSYFQVDLSKLVNLGFTNATSGELGKKGIWPDVDLVDFPTGKQTFDGVPFNILAPKSCVALRAHQWFGGQYRPFITKDLPLRVVIPVNRRADVLVFLHAGFGIGNSQWQWSYVIHRRDGSKEEIKMIGDENIRNFLCPKDTPFDREYPTTTKAAWTKYKQWGKGGIHSGPLFVYMTTWVNVTSKSAGSPNGIDIGWSDVTEIEMISREVCMPMLIGITGGIAH